MLDKAVHSGPGGGPISRPHGRLDRRHPGFSSLIMDSNRFRGAPWPTKLWTDTAAAPSPGDQGGSLSIHPSLSIQAVRLVYGSRRRVARANARAAGAALGAPTARCSSGGAPLLDACEKRPQLRHVGVALLEMRAADEDKVRAGIGERRGRRPADAAPGTGDQRPPAVERKDGGRGSASSAMPLTRWRAGGWDRSGARECPPAPDDPKSPRARTDASSTRRPARSPRRSGPAGKCRS
jgi:hypothetical protein